jgi:monoamine oxidase
MKSNFKRREFLKLAMLSAGSLALSPYSLTASEFKSLRRKGDPKRVIIIGAGLAGLSAALELKRNGHSVTVLESQTTAGGRVRTMRENLAEGFYAELGAGRVPDNHEWTLKYINEFGLKLSPFYPTTLDSVHFMRNKLIRIKPGQQPGLNQFPADLTARELSLGLDGLFEQSLGEKVHLTIDRKNWPPKELHNLDKTSLKEFLLSEGWSPDVYEVLGLHPFDDLSMLEVLRIIGNGHGSKSLSKIVGGNDQLPKAFASRLSEEIQYGAPVFRIEHNQAVVDVMYRQFGEVKKISGDRLICTIPNSVLRMIEISPSLSQEKSKIINEMGYASLSRYTFQVSKRYWTDQGLSGFGYTDIGGEIWHPTFDREGNRGLLQLYLYNKSSELVSAMSETQQESYGISQVNRVFPGLNKYLEGVFVHCWDNDPWARGASRNIHPGQVVEFHKNMSKPEGNIYFGGEHTSTFTGYMNGAIESGIRTAKEVNES